MRALLLFLFVSSTQALDIMQWTTPEGAKVLFAQTQGLPMLDIQLSFDAASARDGGKFGLAFLTNRLLSTATKYHDEEQIIHAFESVGAQFSRHISKDMATASLRTLTRAEILKKSLATFTEVITQPSFQQSYLTREKRQNLRKIEANKQSPASVAALAFNSGVFADHPYQHPKIGTKESIANISIKDLEQHYQRYYVAKNLTIALVGDISKPHAKEVARQISHGLNSGEKAQQNPMVSALKKAKNKHIDFPSKQTHLLIGQVGINRSDPDYYPLYLGNHILGGSGLTSILNDEIREKRGLAYSVHSSFNKLQSKGYFLIKLQTKNTQTLAARKIALKTLADFIDQPLSAKTLQLGKDNIIGGFVLETASNSKILAYLSVIGFYDLPLDYLSNFVDKIKPISAKQVQTAFKNLLAMDKLLILTVGQN